MPRRRSATVANEALAAVNERYPGAMMMASDPSLLIEHLPTGILSIDVPVGGFARGRHIELYGGYGVGKTYLTYCFIATSQAAGLRCAFLDVEGTFDPVFAASIGVDLAALVFPERGQNANRLVNIMEILLRSGEFDVIVLDSIAALLPAAEEDADMESGSMGTQQAKLMSQGLRRLTAANRRTVCVYINQTRQKIGVMFGPNSITSGGKAMAFYAATRLELVKTETIKRPARTVDTKSNAEKKTDRVAGHRVLVRVEKDKTGAVRQQDETTFVFDYDLGAHDPVEDLIYLGRRYQLIHVRSKQWSLDGYEDEAKAGRPKFKTWLRRNRIVQDDLETMIRSAHAAATVDEPEEPEEAPESP